ncbi:hypothetical protein GJAV_G00093360 [Gymnothorax javanicus]|nr:hypothetical protein GJAV_G00093360 [Gymnothorax javanicus]
MMFSLRLLCLVALLSLGILLAEAVGPVVQCEPCYVASVSQCKPVPSDCTEKVREPGCGCCMTCALNEGQPCGIYTSKCGSGLTCQSRPGETRPLLALLDGRGICSRLSSGNHNGIAIPTLEEDNATDEDGSPKGTGSKDGQHGSPPKATISHPKAEVTKKDENRKPPSSKGKLLSSGISLNIQNFFESKEMENGPCRREMESVLKSLTLRKIIHPQGFHIPNCDRNGFYKKKQCRPSKGRQRGLCWCVDRYGQVLPGIEGTERSDAQCYSSENQ